MLRAMSAQSTTEMTLEEWANLGEDVEGELVDGHLEEEEVTDATHEVSVAWLVGELRLWASRTGATVMGSEAGFAVALKRGRKPDVSVYLAAAPRPPRRGVIRAPPSIVVEVVSPRPRDQRRDRVEKVDDYAKFGVRWYWLVDPELRSFEVLELGADGRYVHALGATEGIVDGVPGCEGLRIDLGALWGEIDALAEGEEGA
jgi:Uma2 family endonuclease